MMTGTMDEAVKNISAEMNRMVEERIRRWITDNHGAAFLERVEGLAQQKNELEEQIRNVTLLNERLAKRADNLRRALEKTRQFCIWLSRDSKKFPETEAGSAGRSELMDIESVLAQDKEIK